MWALARDARWEKLLHRVQKYFKESKIYYSLKEVPSLAGDALTSSYVLRINNTTDYYIYFWGDVSYSLPQKLVEPLDFVKNSFFSVPLGGYLKLKNVFICDTCDSQNIFVIQLFLPLGYFCACNSVSFISKILKLN